MEFFLFYLVGNKNIILMLERHYRIALINFYYKREMAYNMSCIIKIVDY